MQNFLPHLQEGYNSCQEAGALGVLRGLPLCFYVARYPLTMI